MSLLPTALHQDVPGLTLDLTQLRIGHRGPGSSRGQCGLRNGGRA
jgi:hypothetical protein